jgi:hypothetical protein
MNATELQILQHSLGLDQYGQGKSYRSHFVTGPESKDFETCRALCKRGFMRDFGPRESMGGMHLFNATEEGAIAVRRESPAPPKLTPSQLRYRRFLEADFGYSFIEWLKMQKGAAS